jgi:UDP-glucose 4-epimerase
MNILVTGGAGFIGSHLIDYLIKDGHNVTCIDDLSLGKEKNVKEHIGQKNFRLVKIDILNKNILNEVFKENKFECVFHFAANSDISRGFKYINVDLEKTFMTTVNILECMKNNNVKKIVFASSSAIYGELNKVLREDTGPLFPISFYGAAKVSSEAYISVFCANYEIKAWIFRFPNVVGERATHGVVYDFINKLKKNPKELVILGDGKQNKPYIYVKDLVDGIIFAWKNSNNKINCFNLGVSSTITVTKIAKIVVEEMGLKNVKFVYTGGARGWAGDVPKYKFDFSKIKKLGWKANLETSEDAIREAVRCELDKF